MNKITILSVLLIVVLWGETTAQSGNLWTNVGESSAAIKAGNREIIPAKYQTFRLDVPALRQELIKTSVRNGTKEPAKAVIDFPFDDGHIEQFTVEKIDVLHPELGAKYPSISSYMGTSRQNPLNIIYISLYENQFRGLIAGSRTIYMDPYSQGDDEHYIIYDRSDLQRAADDNFVCHTKDEDLNLIEPTSFEYANRSSVDGVLRTYRIAIACTSEYSAYYGNTIAGVLAAVNTTMTRVNSVYRRDLNLTFQVVASQNRLIYINNYNTDANPDPDPYDNYDGSGMLSVNTANITGIIGVNAYDIGHVFSTGGGGIAGTSPCNSSSKGSGVTGIVTPQFDPFDIDYVCHEIGHQFGAGHTYYNACFGAKVSDDYEPGSGSTILGYAGICAPNVQANSDAYFHARSIAQMTTAMTGHGCESESASTNTGNPTIGTLTSYTIPKGTPFVLTGNATDSNTSDVITYCWEQYSTDNGGAQPPTATNTAGPQFRSFYPTTSGSRYFPNLDAVIANTTPTWEVLPNVARSMPFRLTVRDNHPNGGRTNFADMTVTVASSGPFVVTAPNTTGIVWYAGDSQTVTWNVNNTTAAPVSTANVKISLSTDGGYTYPIVLLESTPNDGTQAITVPNSIGKNMRIKVEALNNIYYDISNANFEIKSNSFEFTASASTVAACKPASAVFNLTFNKAPSFNETVTFSAVGLPAGASASFSPSSRTATGAVTMTVSGLSNVSTGIYNFEARGTSASSTLNTPLILKVVDNNIGKVALSMPENGAENQQTSSLLKWGELTTASAYQVQISTDPTFSTITEAATVSINQYQTAGLTQGTIVYWRVKPVNSCTEGAFSETYVFQIAADVCKTYNNVYYEDNDNTWNTGSNNAVSARIDVPDDIEISDVNFTMVASHTQMTDIKMQFSGPTGIFTEIYNRDCSGSNVNVTFDDQGSAIPVPCTGGLTGTRQSSQPLAKFNGSSSLGSWVLLATDRVSATGSGTFTSLSLKICGKLQTVNNVNATINAMQTNSGAVSVVGTSSLSAAQPTALNTELIYVLTRLPINGTLKKNNMAIVQGGTFNQADINAGAVTYTHSGSLSSSDNFAFSVRGKNNAILGGQVMTIAVCALEASTSVTPVLCSGQATGSATVVVSGGTPNYTYQWAPTGGSSATALNLSAGEYSCTITDANGCVLVKNVTILQPQVLTINSSSAINVSCFSGSDGALSVTVAGGTPGYTYDWSPGAPIGDGTSSITGLKAGNYTCTITDANGCSVVHQVTLTQPQLLMTNVPVIKNVTCFGSNDGTATLTATGGEAPYTYEWTPSVPVGSGTGSVGGLSAGTYTCTITDLKGCSTTRNVTINQPAGLSGTVTSTDVSCNGTATGSASIAVSGGTAPYSYNWFPGMPSGNGTASVSGLVAGTYYCTVTDTAGCAVTSSVIITQPSFLTTNYTVTNLACYGGATGVISLNVSGGTAPYTYDWSPGTPIGAGTSRISGLTAGAYSCTITDAKGCTLVRNFSLGQPLLPLTSTVNAKNDVSCFGQANGSATVLATGGTGPYYYFWSPSVPVGNGTGSVSGLAAGNYTCTIFDNNGCTSVQNITIAQPANSLAAILQSSNDVSCSGGSDGTAVVAAQGGTEPYQYEWSTGGNTDMIMGLSAGTYSCTVTDANGCSAITTVIIDQPEPFSVIESQTNVTCKGSANGVASVGVTGGTGLYTYEWGPGAPVGDGTSMVTGLTAGTWTCLIADENNCAVSKTFVITEPADLSVTSSHTHVSCLGVAGSAAVTAAGGTGPYSYQWLPTGGNSSSAMDLAPGAYTCIITDANNCSVEQLITIESDVTTWTSGGWSNGMPTASMRAVIAFPFTPDSDLTACALDVTGTATVTVPSGVNFYITNKVTVAPGAVLIFENNANLLQIDAVNNEGKITSHRSTFMKRLDYTYWSSPVVDQNLKAFSPQTVSPPLGSSRFYILDEPSNLFQTVDPILESFSLAKGYMIRAPNNFTNTSASFMGKFTGVPHNGDINLNVTNSGVGRGFNLIGNPYPSTVDAMAFLSVNPGSLYFWTHRTQISGDSNYATFNTSGGVAAIPGEVVPNGFIQTGQAFLYQVAGTGTAIFNNAMRSGNTDGQFFRNGGIERHRYWLNLFQGDEPVNQIMVNYMSGATMAFDVAIDGPLHPNANTSIATLIGDEAYAIQGRSLPFAVSDEVPMYFRAAAPGMYSIALDAFDGLFAEGQQIYIQDNLLSNTHNLAESPYSFTSETGLFNDRFRIVYQNVTLPTDFYANESQIIMIRKGDAIGIQSNASNIREIEVYDVLGRLLFKTIADDVQQFVGGHFYTDQVLLVKVKTSTGSLVSRRVL